MGKKAVTEEIRGQIITGWPITTSHSCPGLLAHPTSILLRTFGAGWTTSLPSNTSPRLLNSGKPYATLSTAFWPKCGKTWLPRYENDTKLAFLPKVAISNTEIPGSSKLMAWYFLRLLNTCFFLSHFFQSKLSFFSKHITYHHEIKCVLSIKPIKMVFFLFNFEFFHS